MDIPLHTTCFNLLLFESNITFRHSKNGSMNYFIYDYIHLLNSLEKPFTIIFPRFFI